MQDFLFYLLNIILASFTIFLIFIYVKSDSFKKIPFYFNILFCLTVTIDNLLRLIPANEDDIDNFLCKLQAFFLTFFDKLFIASITIYSIMNYMIMIHFKIYEKKEQLIYFMIVIAYIFISFGLSILDYVVGGLSESSLNHHFCYVKTSTDFKKNTDFIFLCSLFAIDVFCIIRALCKIRSVIKQREGKHNKRRRKNLKFHFWRIIIHFFLNTITFSYLILSVKKVIKDIDANIRDYIYIMLCLIAECFFTINAEFLRESMRIVTCNKIEKFKKKSSQIELLGENEEDEEDIEIE
jgi:hypothetical protein